MENSVQESAFRPPSNYSSPNLEKYLAATKTDVLRLAERTSSFSTNMSSAERQTMDSLKKRKDIIITSADKGGKIVVMDRSDYLENCTSQLENDEFYVKISNGPTNEISEEIGEEIKSLKENKLINNNEFNLLSEFLTRSRTGIFYGLPKIHKSFDTFPPLRPIVSGFSTCTSRLSDTFLKYQAKKCKSYFWDTKDFLQKIQKMKKLRENSILVMMDI